MRKIKRFLLCSLAIGVLLLLMGCTNSEQTKKINNIKNGLEAKVAEVIRTVDVPASSIDDVVHSLEFYYDEPEIKENDIRFSGEFSYILGDKKYFQPFTVTGNLSTENFSLSTAGTRVRVENASSEELSEQEDWQQSNCISESQKQKIAENAACLALIEKMENSTWPLYSSWYDLESTGFRIGKVTADGNRYTVMGTALLYDNYGAAKETVEFYVYVDVDDYGYVNSSTCFIEE